MPEIPAASVLTPPLQQLASLAFLGLVWLAPPAAVGWEPLGALQARPVAAASRAAWPVAVPATATVRLKTGGSLSGRLVRFSASTLSLAAGQQSQTVAMAKVASIEFAQPNDLWVTLPNGLRQQLRPVRGLSLPIDGLPGSALQLNAATSMAVVDLTPALTEAQFAKLSRNPDVVFVLIRLVAAADGGIGLRLRPYGVQ